MISRMPGWALTLKSGKLGSIQLRPFPVVARQICVSIPGLQQGPVVAAQGELPGPLQGGAQGSSRFARGDVDDALGGHLLPRRHQLILHRMLELNVIQR